MAHTTLKGLRKRMNLLDAHVTKVVSEPKLKYGKWFVSVEADCYGRPMTTELMFETEEQARQVEVGHEFLT